MAKPEEPETETQEVKRTETEVKRTGPVQQHQQNPTPAPQGDPAPSGGTPAQGANTSE